MSGWWDIREPDNRAMLGWLGGGLAIATAGLWAAFVYLFPPKDEHGGGSIKVEAICGSAAVQGNMIGSSITTGGASSNCPPKPASP